MVTRTAWRDARRDDRQLLQSFCCTVEPRRDPQGRPLSHPRPWEREVEAWIRSRTPPAGPREALRLETEEAALRAVAGMAVAEQRHGMVIVKLLAIAVNVIARGGDGTVADGAIDDAFRAALTLTSRLGALAPSSSLGYIQITSRASDCWTVPVLSSAGICPSSSKSGRSR